jgi:N-acylglucosamine-6-phosphate 2-epimerase
MQVVLLVFGRMALRTWRRSAPSARIPLSVSTKYGTVYITPNFAAAAHIAQAGADIIGIDATRRPRDGEPIDQLIARIRQKLQREVFADVSTVEEGRAAHAAGATYIATTLAGYTEETAAGKGEGPDLELLSALVAAIDGPVVAEGRFDTPALVAEAFKRGAHAVVVGTAITNPREITKRFVEAATPWASAVNKDGS